ncbi:hypothetical protein AB5J52_06110 [Streptomyces sp. R39]|uniref:Uncharacterized protein n=1 Tax=Streptomyces sp. R39 TaxID=3238631 RepID=A0AB39QGV1_9ACTN
MSRRVWTAGALGHLLLVVVLAVCVLVMHTLGHPTSPSTGMGTPSHAPAAALRDGPAVHEAGSADASTGARPTMNTDRSSSAHMPPAPMDMLSLCLAVLLGASFLAALLRAALTRRSDWLARLLAQAPVLLRPNPPPRGPHLTQLSVLRL